MDRIEREKGVLRQMFVIFCRGRHKGRARTEGLCAECAELLRYARERTDHCPQGERKRSCRVCEIHCYAPSRKEEIRSVMRYAGPRMIFHHPLAALRHLILEKL